MDTKTLTTALQGLNPAEYEWSFALYSAHKSRDGLALQWHRCEMRGLPVWLETVIRFQLEKTIPDRSVVAYSPVLPKENIGALAREDELIRDQLREMLLGLQGTETLAAEDFARGVVPKPVGYGFYGVRAATETEEAREVLFLRRANPFLSGVKALLCVGSGGAVTESETPLLKFQPQADFVLLGEHCYFLSENIAKDFELESRAAAVCARRLAQVAEADVVSDYEQLEAAALSGKHIRKFQEFDRKILDHIVSLPVASRLDFLVTYGITLDLNGRMDTSDPEQCELIIDLLCGRSCLDAFGRLATGVKITPRE
ncbi:MAG: hypothetical protein LBJ11_03005 [Oscillospiraceae bacterium]|jgi:hypothetical protein|nr:hypothetical protein [Oscillospiraceae bacterium]